MGELAAAGLGSERDRAPGGELRHRWLLLEDMTRSGLDNAPEHREARRVAAAGRGAAPLARALLALCVVFHPAPPSARAVSELPEGDPGKEWRAGPVQYLLTPEEYGRYGKLKTEEARKAFASRFWRRLDPDPETPENEFEARFERLCAIADERFSTPLVKGWRTDRGRVLIVLGEPDSVRRTAGDPVSISREIWTYTRRPGGGAAPLEIVFYGDRSGGFRLQPRAGAETEVYLDPIDLQREFQRVRALQLLPTVIATPIDWKWILDTLAPYENLAAALRSHPGRPRSVPSPSPRSSEASAAAGLPASPIVSDASYFFQAADGGIVSILVLEYRPEPAAGATPVAAPEGQPEASASAWIMDERGRLAGRPQLEAALRLERRPDLESGGTMVFTGRAYLEPGAYGARYAVEDRVGKSLAIRNVALTVPDIPLGELAASTVVPAERFGPVVEGQRSPYAVGSEEVVPKPGAIFHHGEQLRVYFQVYGAARDPASRRPHLDVKFRFERAGSRKFVRHGQPAEVRGAAGESMGLTLPVDDWPPGDYRVAIDLVDRITGSRTTTEGRFRIAD